MSSHFFLKVFIMVSFDNYQNVINGLAMKDIETDGITLQVFPTELLPGAVSGGFKPASTTSKFTQTNVQGQKVSNKATTTNHITAVWRSFNGESKPNKVEAGQQVILYQVGDTDKWYWSFKARDPEMGTTDHRVHYMPARKKEHTGKLPTDEDSYVQGMDTTKGMVTFLKSSQKLGEPVAIHNYANTKDGIYILTDNQGVNITKEKGLGNVKTSVKSGPQYSNSLFWDFKNSTFQVRSSEGSYNQIVKKDIVLHSERDIILNAKRQIVIQAPTITFNSQQAGGIVFNAANIALNVTGSIVAQASVFGINAVTKITKAVVTAGIRCTQIVTGSTGSPYNPVKTDIQNGSTISPNNSPDTNTAGVGDRSMAAFPQVQAALNEIANLINTISNAHTTGNPAPLGLDTSGITINAEASQCSVIKGE